MLSREEDNTTGVPVAPPATARLRPAATSKKNGLFNYVSQYVDRLLPDSDRAMKVLLVDVATLPIISMAVSQTALLQKNVFLVDDIGGGRQRKPMKNMHCIIFIRPELSSVDAACTELHKGKYQRYSIVFSGPTKPEFLDRLAQADLDLLVSNVEEIFCDFSVVNRDAFMTELLTRSAIRQEHMLLSTGISDQHIQRVAEGLATLCVAQRRKPFIRFQGSSPFARRVATALTGMFRNDLELYDYKHRDTTLLILDRSDDPITPLLTPWTYQAMLHEHIGLSHNTLHLPAEVSGADEAGYVFSEQDDVFYATNMFQNWGDLCNNVKMYVDKCKEALNIDRSTATMEELKDFMQRLPQTQSLTGSVTKHTTVTSYLSGVIKKRELLDVSLLEQDMISGHNEKDHFQRLQRLATHPKIDLQDALRLCLLYHMRYETASAASATSKTGPFLDRLSSQHTNLLRRLREYYGTTRSTDGLFAETGVMASIARTFGDVGNIYTQHEPVLKRTLQQLYSGRLDTSAYPYMKPLVPRSAEFKPHEVVVFMCGGYTFEEAALVRAVNNGTAYKPSETTGFPQNVLTEIGGERVLNTSTFLELLSS